MGKIEELKIQFHSLIVDARFSHAHHIIPYLLIAEANMLQGRIEDAIKSIDIAEDLTKYMYDDCMATLKRARTLLLKIHEEMGV